MKKVLLNILLVIFICAFCFSGYKVFMWLKYDRETKKLENGLYSEVVNVKQNSEKKDEIVVDFKTLKEVNDDVIGWIKIENTHINYPILQGETDEFYLRKDIYKKYNYSGSIFVYSNVDKNFLDENTVIYGHNMKNQRMFADLYEIYKGKLGNDIEVLLNTEDDSSIYKVFSCYVEKPNLEITKNQFSDNEKEEYIKQAISKSKIDFTQEVNFENKIITLVTCGSSSEERVIVHATKII